MQTGPAWSCHLIFEPIAMSLEIIKKLGLKVREKILEIRMSVP